MRLERPKRVTKAFAAVAHSVRQIDLLADFWEKWGKKGKG